MSSQLTSLPMCGFIAQLVEHRTGIAMCGSIAQLVEHRTGIAEVTGSNPVEALIFFRLLYSNCFNWKFTVKITYHLNIAICGVEMLRAFGRGVRPLAARARVNPNKTASGAG